MGAAGPQGLQGPAGARGPIGPVPATTDATGSATPVDTMPPFVNCNYIISLEGAYPPRGAGPTPAPYAMLGEIRTFAGNFAPAGWALCDGDLLEIEDYQSLYSVLGTAYGGDGRTTFGLPDLRGRIPVQQGNAPGLTWWSLGEGGGSERVTLTEANMASHSHTITTP